MLLLELAAQSVRGFSPSVRAALKGGYVGLKSPGDELAPFGGLLLALWFPDGRGGDASFLAPQARAGRAGLSMQANDGSIYRLVRDLGGTGGLHKQNPATKQYEAVTQDAAELSQTVRAIFTLPPRTTYEHLFVFARPQLPTLRPKRPKAAPAAAKPRKVQSSAYDPYSGSDSMSVMSPESRIEQLENELRSAREAAELQFKMDGVQADTFKAESRLKAYGELRAKVEAARQELAAAPSPASLGLPDDIVERVRRFNDEKKKRDEALIRLQSEKADAVDESALRVEPLWRDRQFWFLLLSGLGLLVGAAVLEGIGRYLSLLSIPIFALAALVALRFIESLQHRSREAAKLDVFTVREKKLYDDFQLANSTVQMAFEKTQAATNDEFYAAMATREQLAPHVGALELELADFESDPEVVALPQIIQGLKTEHDTLNQKLLSLSGGYVREVREIERDLAHLRESLAPAQPAGEVRVVSANVETYDDPMPALLSLGAELFATDVPSLWGLLKDRANQYLKALSDQRYHAAEVTIDGRASVLAPGRTVPATELPGRDLDLLYLCVRLTLVEKYAAHARVPVIIEDAFDSSIDAAKHSLVGRMLKHIGSLTQVIQVLPRSASGAACDVVVAV